MLIHEKLNGVNKVVVVVVVVTYIYVVAKQVNERGNYACRLLKNLRRLLLGQLFPDWLVSLGSVGKKTGFGWFDQLFQPSSDQVETGEKHSCDYVT